MCFVCVAVYLSDFTTDLTLLVGRSDFSVYLLCVGLDSVKTCNKTPPFVKLYQESVPGFPENVGVGARRSSHSTQGFRLTS